MIVTALVVCACITRATANPYPDHAIHVVVPFAPGGGVDAAARVFADRLNKAMNVPVVIDNRDGAGGIVGAGFVAHAAPDGYTILFGGIATHGILPNVQKNLPYDPVKDFAPVIGFVRQPLVLVVNPSVPAKSVADLIALAKREPGKLSYASAGVGTLIHLLGAMLNSMAGIDIRHIPYRGVGPALLDVLAGRVDIIWSPYVAIADDIRNGRLRALAVTTAQPGKFTPGLPPVADTVRGYDATSWYGILVPAATPPAIVTQLNQVIAGMLADKDVAQKLGSLGLEPIGGSPADFASFIKSELLKWHKAAEMAGVAEH